MYDKYRTTTIVKVMWPKYQIQQARCSEAMASIAEIDWISPYIDIKSIFIANRHVISSILKASAPVCVQPTD